MKRKLIPLLMFCLSFILPSAIFANDIPTFPPTLPFSYNGVTYTNALAKSGNTSSCGGFLNIKDIWYYNKKPTFNIYALTGSVYGTPPTGVVSIGVDHASQAVRFLSQSQTSADNYVATEYPNGVSFGVCSQCYRTRIDPSTVYTNTDIYQYNSTVLFKGANVSTYHQLYVTINPTGGGTITSLPPCLTCNNGLCMGSCSGTVSLTASPASGYASDGWEYENNAYSGET
ncbi:MAG TPA: hypothetical protein DIC35_01750, partial [Candidatus Moranbacteria bacterium]|nr:hypothetical protein [Candidatus Moranbacteria bacterium]